MNGIYGEYISLGIFVKSLSKEFCNCDWRCGDLYIIVCSKLLLGCFTTLFTVRWIDGCMDGWTDG